MKAVDHEQGCTGRTESTSTTTNHRDPASFFVPRQREREDRERGEREGREREGEASSLDFCDFPRISFEETHGKTKARCFG